MQFSNRIILFEKNIEYVMENGVKIIDQFEIKIIENDWINFLNNKNQLKAVKCESF